MKLLKKIIFKLSEINHESIHTRIDSALQIAAASAASRIIDPANPASWGFSGFSCSNEDGIIDYLTRRIINPNHYFIEIGAGNGIDNNTAWLAMVRKYSGIMIDGDDAILNGKKINSYFIRNVEFVRCFLNTDNVKKIKEMSMFNNPDIVSLDIDGNDFYIAKEIFELGMRPKIFVVEYNSVFGPDKKITIEYDPQFRLDPNHLDPVHFYHGVSISAWKAFFNKYGYQFITVEQTGVNAFFVNPSEFDKAFLDVVIPLDFRDNFYQLANFRMGWEERFKYIAHRKFYQVD
jgi:hypothetical protein